MMLFDFHVHEKQRLDSMEGFDFRGFFEGLDTYEKRALPKAEILKLLRNESERWCGWVEALPEARAAETVRTRAGGPSGKSRFEMLIGTKEHEMHHRAQLMVIERLLGIVPHLTRNRQGVTPTPEQKKTA